MVSEMGLILLVCIFELNDIQVGVFDIVFKLVDDRGLLLLDMDDLCVLFGLVVEECKDIFIEYGLVSVQLIVVIQCLVLCLVQDGGENFFGELVFELVDIMWVNYDGRGMIGIFVVDQLVFKFRFYFIFLLWLLLELFEQLLEVGDLDKLKLVFIFDEVYLLFDDVLLLLVQCIEQVVCLICFKGVGVYFCLQFFDDVLGNIFGQLGNCVQYVLCVFILCDQKVVKIVVEMFVLNLKLDVVKVLSQFGIGEVLVFMLQDKGVLMFVQQMLIVLLCCWMGLIIEVECVQVCVGSLVGSCYDIVINCELVVELLVQCVQKSIEQVQVLVVCSCEQDDVQEGGFGQVIKDVIFGIKCCQGMIEIMVKQIMCIVGIKLGNQIVCGIFGGIFGGKC